jgi:hypothetical protein
MWEATRDGIPPALLCLRQNRPGSIACTRDGIPVALLCLRQNRTTSIACTRDGIPAALLCLRQNRTTSIACALRPNLLVLSNLRSASKLDSRQAVSGRSPQGRRLSGTADRAPRDGLSVS